MRALAAIAFSLSVASCGPPGARIATGSPRPGGAGPVDITRPEHAATARDGGELAALLASPDGPGVIWLPTGIYRGAFKVRRPVSIHGALGAVLEGTGTGTVVDVEASDVTLDNVTIRNSGGRHTTEDAGVKAKGERVVVSHTLVDGTLFGVTFAQCHHCNVEHSEVRGRTDDPSFRGDSIKLWESDDSTISDTVVRDGRDLVVWYTRRARLSRNHVSHGRYGTHFMYAHDCVVEDSTLEANVVGIFVMYSNRVTLARDVLSGSRGAAGMGLGCKESDAIRVTDTQIVGNATGVYLDRTPRTKDAPAVISTTLIARNDVGIRLHGSDAGVSFQADELVGNAVLAEVDGGGDALGVTMRENYYSEYVGYDLDHDGFGDVAFEQKRLSGELTDAHPSMRLLEGTTAMGTLDAVARAMPVLAAHRLLVDERPRMARRERVGR